MIMLGLRFVNSAFSSRDNSENLDELVWLRFVLQEPSSRRLQWAWIIQTNSSRKVGGVVNTVKWKENAESSTTGLT